MRVSTDLFLLRNNIDNLLETHFFENKITVFLKELVSVVDFVIENRTALPPTIVDSFASQLWRAQSYLAGSPANETPFEMQYCLSKALPEWVNRECVITNALSFEKEFHLFSLDIWNFVKTTLTSFDSSRFDGLLIHMALPRLYRYRPIFCIPLYHELGHFVDNVHQITHSAIIQNPTIIPSAPNGVEPRIWAKIMSMHFKEHFADLFAACYCGVASYETLEVIAPNASPSSTHPSTTDRVNVVKNFLNQNPDNIVDFFQHHLATRNLPTLNIRFKHLDLTSDFDNLVPVELKTERELHGVFSAGWKYLQGAVTNNSPPWAHTDATEFIIEKTINDLTEKSIRNFSVYEAWKNGNPN